MMRIGWLGQGQQRLKQPLRMGGRQQILAAGHQGDAFKRIVHDHGKMIGGRQFLASQHQIAEQQGLDRDGLAMLLERQRPGPFAPPLAASSRTA